MINCEHLPKGWAVARFEDLLDYVQPTTYIVKSTEYNDTYKTPVLTAGKSFIKGYTNETDGIFNSLPTIIFDDFTTATQFVNFPFKVKSSAMKILQPTCDLVNIKLAYYLMQVQHIKGETHKRFWISEYSQLPVPLAPLNEQKRIIDKIEELITDLDKGIEYLETTKQQLKVYRQAVLKWAFEGKLTNNGQEEGKLPKGWIQKKFNDIGKWRGGGTPTKSVKEYWENGSILWVSPKDMKSKVIKDTEDKITLKAIDSSSTKLIPANSILFVVRSGILRRTLPIAITNIDVTLNQDMQAVTPINILPNYVFWYATCKSEEIRHKCSKDGTTVESIESSLLKNFPFVFPEDKNEQQSIINEIESRLSVCDKIEETIENSLLKSEALRLSIIKSAFEGKLVTQNPSDEPAEKLLERIRAAKGKGKPVKAEKETKVKKKAKEKHATI
jgi:type I restriction enzyme S subunit